MASGQTPPQQPGATPPPAANPADVSSIDSIIAAVYTPENPIPEKYLKTEMK